jgi:GNAT superfamily N-acetyltransferase
MPRVSEILQDLSASSLAAANEANLCAAYAMRRHWPEAEVIDRPEALRCLTSIVHPLMNGIFRPRMASGAIASTIDEMMAPFERRRLPMYWWVGPGAQPADLGTHLEAYGLPYDGDVPGMAADLMALPDPAGPPVPDHLMVERLDGTEGLRDVARIVGVAFKMDEAMQQAFHRLLVSESPAREGGRWHHYLARLDGEPVAATSLFPEAGVAGIYNVGTLPEARGRGIAAALVATALRDARDAGYRAATLQSSEMGFRVYQRLGFFQCCTYSHYVFTP